MTKEDLKIGYMVVLRNGYKHLIMLTEAELLVRTGPNGWEFIDTYDCDMKSKNGYSEYDIMKVYDRTKIGTKLLDLSEEHRKLLWEREATLKPCPFCGNKNILVDTIAKISLNDEPDGWDISHYKAVCDFNNGGCGAGTGMRSKTKRQAIESWNKRT